MAEERKKRGKAKIPGVEFTNSFANAAAAAVAADKGTWLFFPKFFFGLHFIVVCWLHTFSLVWFW